MSLFEDTFVVTGLNPDGKRFEKVDRLVAKGEHAELSFDVACEVYPLKVGDEFKLTLASTLNLDGTPDGDEYIPDGKRNLLDDYEYGQCGRTFRYEHESEKRVAVIASFGGLLMLLRGEIKHLVRLQLDQKVYLLVRKAGSVKVPAPKRGK